MFHRERSRDGGKPAEETTHSHMNGRALPRPEPSDEALAARVALRDTSAFASIYDRYARPIYVLAAHMLGSADAEEAVQEVFVRLWNKAGQFDAARGSFSAWFMTIARHYALDELQRRNQRKPLQVADEIEQVLAQLSDAASDVEEQAWRHECGAALRRALLTLPEEQRRVIVLAYFGGLTQSAIAESVGRPLGTVKKRTRLALQKLRAALQQQGFVSEVGSNCTAGQ